MQPIDENENGLQLLSGRSQVEANPPGWQLSELSDLIAAKFGDNEATAVFYLDYGIRFAKWHDRILEFAAASTSVEFSFLQLARIFDQNSELKIWRSDEGLGYRWRVDEQGQDCFAIDARQNLWGTKVDHQELPAGWTKLKEDRGTELIVPLEIQTAVALPAYIKTRNYIGEMANGQATYVDCRFVALGKRGA